MKAAGDAAPSAFVSAVIERLPRGRILDVACGAGRNLPPFVARGDTIFGVDRNRDSLLRARAALGDRAELFLVTADLEQMPLPRASFDIILNVRYLQRSLVPAIRDALRLGGMVVFETFLIEQLALGHPRNPDFVLQHGELPALFHDLRVLHYEEGLFRDGSGESHLARLLAQRA